MLDFLFIHDMLIGLDRDIYCLVHVLKAILEIYTITFGTNSCVYNIE